MNKMFKVTAMLIALLMLCGSSTAYSSPQAEIVKQVQKEQVNQITFDVTYDPAAKSYSLAGLTSEQLKYLGVPGVDQIIGYIVKSIQSNNSSISLDIPGIEKMTWDLLNAFDTIRFSFNKSEICMDVDGEKSICTLWDEQSRKTVFDQISNNIDVSRVEELLGITNIVLNIRNTPETSQSPVIDLATLFNVDVAKDGSVSVEGIDTGVILQSTVYDTVAAGGIGNTTICWSKGSIYTTVNGENLPQITIYQGGVELIDKALNLGMGDIETFFKSQVGVSVSFGGADHEIVYCIQQ